MQVGAQRKARKCTLLTCGACTGLLAVQRLASCPFTDAGAHR